MKNTSKTWFKWGPTCRAGPAGPAGGCCDLVYLQLVLFFGAWALGLLPKRSPVAMFVACDQWGGPVPQRGKQETGSFLSSKRRYALRASARQLIELALRQQLLLNQHVACSHPPSTSQLLQRWLARPQQAAIENAACNRLPIYAAPEEREKVPAAAILLPISAAFECSLK